LRTGKLAATQQAARQAGDNPRSNLLRARVADPKHVFIEGRTTDGKAFRPSDWAERLAGALSSFRPEGSAGGAAAFIGYSPYCEPRYLRGVKGVMVDARLRELEPMAWDFVVNFARDNDLVTIADPEGE
jgi:hypothetical protein